MKKLSKVVSQIVKSSAVRQPEKKMTSV